MRAVTDATRTYLEGGEVIYNVHQKHDCRGPPCPIHHLTDHHMRSFPQHFRQDRRIMERICPHGVGHPDPDDQTTDRIHGCDGCCRPPPTEEADAT